MDNHNFDFVIVGAGIIGLTLARELVRSKAGRIAVLEKEPYVGAHASGRNSGVVHAGIYYSSDSLKARFCVQGARLLLQYAEENKLPVLKCGKVIVSTAEESLPTLEKLHKQALANGVRAEKISVKELANLEPEAATIESALWSPDTAVIDSKAILNHLIEELKSEGVTIAFGQRAFKFDITQKCVKTESASWHYGYLFNASGTNADRIAHEFGVGEDYRILPFKGLYWKSSNEYSKRIQRLIYPVPDVRMPFLGIHITRTIDGKVLFGPTAIPAIGRENYGLIRGAELAEVPSITWNLLKMVARNPNNFRSYVRHELRHYTPNAFYSEVRKLVRKLDRSDIGEFYKVGIRAQLMNLKSGTLEMDFVLKKGSNSFHVLNAISPAFTSSFAIAPYLLREAKLGL